MRVCFGVCVRVSVMTNNEYDCEVDWSIPYRNYGAWKRANAIAI